MRRGILALVLGLLIIGTAQAQHPFMRSVRKNITSAWDSAYVLVGYGPMKIDLYNWSSSDTIRYFFGGSKADSTTAIMYWLFPLQGTRIEIPMAGYSFKCLFRRLTAAGTAETQIEQWPAEEK